MERFFNTAGAQKLDINYSIQLTSHHGVGNVIFLNYT